MRKVAYSLFTYIFIITSCLFCVVLSDSSQRYRFTQIGLIATVGADFFLVFLPFQLKVPGMICFCVTQTAYFLITYIDDENLLRKKIHLLLRIAASVCSIVITVFILGRRVDLLALLSVFYYANLILNVIFSYFQFKKLRVFAIALTLFIVSDTLIGFDNLSSYLLIPRGSIIFILKRLLTDWVMPLYLAAQMMIPMSLLPEKRKSLRTENTDG